MRVITGVYMCTDTPDRGFSVHSFGTITLCESNWLRWGTNATLWVTGLMAARTSRRQPLLPLVLVKICNDLQHQLQSACRQMWM